MLVTLYLVIAIACMCALVPPFSSPSDDSCHCRSLGLVRSTTPNACATYSYSETYLSCPSLFTVSAFAYAAMVVPASHVFPCLIPCLIPVPTRGELS
jgi:hypothetical protein